jgi:acetoin utilization deacetylase AcuC-like enzyme
MLVINAGPNDRHRPPFELDGGVIVPPSEVPERVPAILRGLQGIAGVRIEEVVPVESSEMTALHAPEYVEFLRETCAELHAARRPEAEAALFPSVFPYQPGQRAHGRKAQIGEYCFDTYTPLMAGTFDAALRTASAALRAADRVADSIESMVYAVGRPPGHHAERARFGGYSYLNGTALAAHRLSTRGPVAVLDVDVHHGNGTQHLFYDRADVRAASIHGDPAGLFPYFSGFANETGTGPGLGANRNFPLPPRTDDRAYQPVLESALEWLARDRPAFLVVALGFDTHAGDPIGGFALSTAYFGHIGEMIRQFGLPTIVVQEGGYGLDVIGECAAAFASGLGVMTRSE